MTDNPDFDAEKATRTAELAELDRQIAIRHTSLKTGVPQEFLQNAQTTEQIEQYAQDALAWRGETPAPKTSARSPYPSGGSVNGVSQVSAEALKYLNPQQINQLYAENRLAGLGAPAPPPRQNGEAGGHTQGF